MICYTLESTATLEGFVLAKELEQRAGLSAGAHRFWDCICAKYSCSRTVFIARHSLSAKYRAASAACTDLSGLMSAAGFCALTGISANHLVASNNSALFSALRILRICGVKFVDVAGLYARLGIPQNAHIYIEKCKHFAPSPLEKKIRLTPTLCLGWY